MVKLVYVVGYVDPLKSYRNYNGQEKTSKKIAKVASHLLKNSFSKKVKQVSGSALSQRGK